MCISKYVDLLDQTTESKDKIQRKLNHSQNLRLKSLLSCATILIDWRWIFQLQGTMVMLHGLEFWRYWLRWAYTRWIGKTLFLLRWINFLAKQTK